MTRRKQTKIRDLARTRKKLIFATGEYIARFGFNGLSANKLGYKIDMHYGAVKRAFGSLDGLIEAYVEQNDFWNLYFEKFNVSEDATEKEVRQQFIEMMQAGFDSFGEDRAMQNVILKQISIPHDALMRKISDARENKGAPLLQLTDKFLKNRPVHFRSIIAIVLGGIYYNEIHGSNNGSTVAGVSVKVPEDRKHIRETIAYIINSVWPIKEP